MPTPIPSGDLSYEGFYTFPPMFGLVIAPWRLSTMRFWGRLHTIEYLIRLTQIWGSADNMYGQIETYGNYAPILLGDMAPEGGEKNRWDKCDDHKSHRSGVDFDIYVVRKDGMPMPTNYGDPLFYDFARTKELATAIYAASGSDPEKGVDKVFYDQQTMIDALNAAGIGPPQHNTGRPATADKPALPPTPHTDHFHIRLKRYPPPAPRVVKHKALVATA